MKKLLLLTSLLAIGSLKAQVGCMANSHKLKQKYDSKEMHYVSCHCPCGRHAASGLKTPDRNQCIECGHFHDAQPVYYTSGHHPDRLQAVTPNYNHKKWLVDLISYVKNKPNHN